MDLTFLGATGTVTGSKTLVVSSGRRILVDCGLFQGYKELRLRNRASLGFDPASLDAVILTHAHLDHSGYLPLLVKNGFAGPILCTRATLDLCRILLPDAGRLQEEDAERANRKGYSKHAPAQPLYTEADALQALELFEARPLHEPFEAAPGVHAQLEPAGHILGSAMVRVWDAGCSVLFSGDVGRPRDPIMRPPVAPPAADYLVVESTYGDRRHEAEDPLEELGLILRRVVDRSGVAIIPAFAVGRTQHLLWCIDRLKASGVIPAKLPVYLNSPMAIDATAIYRRHRSEHRLDDAACNAMCHAARYVNTVDESRALNLRHGPMVIIAGSGMATGGRVVHHLKAFAPDPRNCIILAGFQAGGTRGAVLQAGTDSIKVHGEYVAVRAEVRTLHNLSAHADWQEMLDWLAPCARPPRQVFVTHGEQGAAEAMRHRIEERFGWNARVPEFRQTVHLS